MATHLIWCHRMNGAPPPLPHTLQDLRIVKTEFQGHGTNPKCIGYRHSLRQRVLPALLNDSHQ